MSDEQTPSEPPSLDASDPTNARLAALMVEQTGKVLQVLAKIERLIGDPSPTPVEIANRIDDALREDAELETPKFSDFGRFYLSHLVLEIRFPLGTTPSESADPEAEAVAAEEPAGPVIDYIPVSWEEYGERINAALAKSAKKEREMTAMLDAVMAAGWLATSVKGSYVLALAELFATMIPDEEPMTEIPEDWVPVVLAINPMTGEFLTIAGPRSEPDGRVEAVETMVGRLMSNAVTEAIDAVREAGRPQAKPRDHVRPQPKPGDPDDIEYFIVTGPNDELTCEACRAVIGTRIDPRGDDEGLNDVLQRCECVNGCRLAVTHPDDLKAEDESEE